MSILWFLWMHKEGIRGFHNVPTKVLPYPFHVLQPFVCGRYIWMHNGGVGGFHKVRRKLLESLRDDVYQQCPSFESDSAICFALFLNQIQDPMQQLAPEELVAKMEATINEVNQLCGEAGVADELSLLNFVVSDGRTVVATKYCNLPHEECATLYYASGSRFEALDGSSNDYLVRHADRRGLLGIVASEPLTDESADWIQPLTDESADWIQVRRDGGVKGGDGDSNIGCLSEPLTDESADWIQVRSVRGERGVDEAGLAERVGGIVASEPLTDEIADWIEVPRNTAVVPRNTAVVMTRFKGEFVDVLLVPINPPPSVARDISRAFKALASCPPTSLKVSLRRPRRAQARRRRVSAEAQQQQVGQSPVSNTSSQAAFSAATTPPPLPAAASPAAAAAGSGSPVVLPAGGAAGGAGSWKEGLRDLVRDQDGRAATGDEEEEDEDDIDGDAETYGYPSSQSWNGGISGNGTNSSSSVRSRRYPPTTVLPPEGIPLTDRPRHAMAKHRQPVLALAVDGNRVFAGSQDGLITLYDLRDFRCVCTLAGHSQTIFSLSVHHDRLYSSSTRVVKIWDTKTFRLLSTLRYSDGDVFALALALGRSVAGPAGTSIVRCTRASAAAAAAVAKGNGEGQGGGQKQLKHLHSLQHFVIPSGSSFPDASAVLDASVSQPPGSTAAAGAAASAAASSAGAFSPSPAAANHRSPAAMAAAAAAAAAVAAGGEGAVSSTGRSTSQIKDPQLSASGGNSNSSISTETASGGGRVAAAAAAAAAGAAGGSMWESLSSEETLWPQASALATQPRGAGTAVAVTAAAPVAIPQARARSKGPGSGLDGGSTAVGSGGHVVRVGFGDLAQSLSPEAHLYSYLEGARSGGGSAAGSLRGSAGRSGGSYMTVVGEGEEEEDEEVGGRRGTEGNGGSGVGSGGYCDGQREEVRVQGWHQEVIGRLPDNQNVVMNGQVNGQVFSQVNGQVNGLQPQLHDAQAVEQQEQHLRGGTKPCEGGGLGGTAVGGGCSEAGSVGGGGCGGAGGGAGGGGGGVGGAGVGIGCAAGGGGGVRTVCNSTEAALVLTDSNKNGHCSRVYALAVAHPLICSGAGDTFVKVWSLVTGEWVATLHGHKGGVMALATADAAAESSHGSASSSANPLGPSKPHHAPPHRASKPLWRLFSGSRDNTIRVWDLSSLLCITTLTGHTDDVVGLATGPNNRLFSASVDHTIRVWSMVTYECERVFLQEGSIFLSIACTPTGVVTGSSDGVVRYWEVDSASVDQSQSATEDSKGLPTASHSHHLPHSTPSFKLQNESVAAEQRLMEDTLRQLVRMRTVSTCTSRLAAQEMWRAANVVMGLLEDIGAEAKLVVAVDGTSPVVFGRIVQDPSRLTVCICGHYDVTGAGDVDGWMSDPFDLTAQDGFLIGRGVSSSKGPLIASLFAIKDLVCWGELAINIVFVIDGMQENGCKGFKEAVYANLDWFEGTGLILSSDGAWISDQHPCLIYGMRGLICLTVAMSGPLKDLHSGTHGGSFNEPLNDLVTVLSNLVDSNNMILIPGFYDDVKPLDEEEEALYQGLHFRVDEYKARNGLAAVTGGTAREVLQSCWRSPSLSVLGVSTSPSCAPSWSSLPKAASARVVIRHVPNQNPDRLVHRFRAHVAHEFAKLRSAGNSVAVTVEHVGDWWLADPSCSFYQLAEKCIQSHWDMPPMYIREGGTMPVVPFLEAALGAPAIKIPISQATDGSALQNERLEWSHLIKGKDVIRDFIKALGDGSRSC
ncbi:unnamed protein product [Closterium sp. NIES-64]|nr:unnamed protein product [Closterium sp. NIES-64]